MNWNIALVSIIVALLAVIVWLVLEIRQLERMRNWECQNTCPISKGPVYLTPIPPVAGETQWDRLLREEGDPADISTSGAEFAMPEAKG